MTRRPTPQAAAFGLRRMLATHLVPDLVCAASSVAGDTGPRDGPNSSNRLRWSFEPLGFVVGSSIYHVGLQVGRWNQNTELQVLTQAMYSARELARARMRAEADHLAADGIVGVRLRMQMYAWGQNCLEFVATGTAAAQSSGVVGVTVEVKNHVWGEHATEFLATGTAVRRLADEHRLPETSPKPTFTLGLDS